MELCQISFLSPKVVSPNKATSPTTPTPEIKEVQEIDYCKDIECEEFEKCQPKNEGF